MKKIFLFTSFLAMVSMGLLQAAPAVKPTLSKLYATPFAGEVLQYNNAAAMGTLDATFDSDGVLNVNSVNSGGQAAGIQALPNGNFLVVVSGTPSTVGQYNAQGTLQTTSYGTSGIATLGTSATPRATMLDAQGRLLVAGGATSGSAGWINRVPSNGLGTTIFTTSSAWQYVGGLAQQSTGEIIAVGFNGTNAQIARYSLAGSLDTTFGAGATGYVPFDGTHFVPTSTLGLCNIILDSSDNIYTLYFDASQNAFIAKFNASGVYQGVINITAFTSLQGADPLQIRIAFDVNSNIIVAGITSFGYIYVTATSNILNAGTTPTNWTNFVSTSTAFTTSSFQLGSLSTSSNGSSTGTIYLMGSQLLDGNNTQQFLMVVFGLDGTGSSNSYGQIDTEFNAPYGYAIINPSGGTGRSSSPLNATAFAPNGQLYAAGYQIDSSVTTPYVLRFNNTPYVSQVAQFPAAAEQGIFDTSFGTNSTQSFAGVTMPYNGNFAGILQQQTRTIVELATGGFLVGCDGYTDTSAYKNMMLTWLTSAGNLDTNFGSSTGKLSLPNVSSSNETMAALAVDNSGIIYAVGTNGTPLPYIRSYESTGNAITSLNDTGTAAVGIAIQGTAGILLFAQDSATTGHISRYTSTSGTLALDTTFGVTALSGKITTTQLGLNMGPVYGGGLVNRVGRIVIAYKNSSTGAIDVAMINNDGTALVAIGFGTAGSGIATNVFDDLTIPASNVRIAFDANVHQNIYVAAVNAAGTAYLLTRLKGLTGIVDPTFNGGNVLTITPESVVTALTLTNVTGVSDGTVMLTGYDAATDPVMLTMRVANVNNVASLDTTFNSQGTIPGVMPMQIENETANYSARVATGLAVQSYAGVDQGNIIYCAYEKQISTQSTPEVMRLFGATGTTQVERFPIIEEPLCGTIDVAYGTDGAKDLNTILGLPAGQAKAINVITTGAQAGKMLVADSNGTTTTLTMLNSTSTAVDANAFDTGVSSVTLTDMPQAQAIMVDSTGLIFYVLGTNGVLKSVTYASGEMISFATSLVTTGYAITQQASGRILVAGKNVSNEGVIAAYTPAGVVDTSFNPSAAANLSPNDVPGYWNINLTNPVTAISVGATSNAQQNADQIFFAYDNYDGNAAVASLLENGTMLNPYFTFGTPIASVSDASQIKMQIDSNGKIVLVANTGGAAGIKAARYTATGVNDVTAATILANTSGQVLENILTCSDGSTLILAAVPNATATSAYLNIARLTSAFVLDIADFNTLGTTPGVLSTNVPASIFTPVMTDFYALDVIAAGGILIAGDNSPTASSAHPYLSEIVNLEIVTKVPQSATALGGAGVLDTTFNAAGTTPGYMNLFDELITPLPTGTRKITAMLQSSNGTYYIGAISTANSYITQMNDDDVQNTAWGNTSPTLDGLLKLTGKADLASMIFAQSGAIIAVGGNGLSDTSTGWALQCSPADGALNTTFAPTIMLDGHFAVAQQSNGRILVAGVYNPDATDVGAIIAYNPETGAVDTTFGTNGIYTATGYGAINSMIVDASDNIYCMVNDASNNAKVVKLMPSGAGAASGWTIPTVTGDSTIATNNYLALNQAGNIVAVGVNTTTPQIVLTTITASSGSASSALNLAVGLTGITTPKVTAIMVDMNTSPGKVILTGYDSSTSPNTPFVLRTNTAVSALDTTFNTTGVQLNYSADGATGAAWYAGMINANGKITVGGYEFLSPTNIPYLMRLYGDEFKAQYLPSVAAGTPGTIDTNFATAGYLSLIGNGQATSAIPQVVLPTSTPGGAQYVAFSDGTISRYTNANILDLTYNSTGHATASQPGVFSMSMLTNGGLLVAGTNPNGATNGWVEQYTTAGIPDTTFNSNGTVTLANGTIATVAVQQSLSRIVVAGKLASGNGALFALTNAGVADQTFAVGSVAGTGIYDTNIATTIYAMIADQYDRLIIAYKNGSNVDIRRLTASGELDTTFGTDGTIASAITDADEVAQVRIAIDYLGNIVVAAHTVIGMFQTAGISIVSCDNNSGTVLYTAPNIITLATPTLSSLIATADDKILIGGNQSGLSATDMWVARVTSSGTLDATTFNPNATAGSVAGIMQFNAGSSGGVVARSLSSIAIYGDGQISMVGTQTASGSSANNPFMSRAYCNPYTTQQPIDLDAKAAGINDLTFGVSSTAATDLGVTFYATTNGIDQVARAAVMQDGNDNGLVVAVDGTSITTGGANCMYLNMFDIDGLLNTSFKPSTDSNTDPGQLLVLSMFDNQYVNDMLTFTVDGVSKAILAGYAVNATPSLTGSLLMQVVLTAASPGLDASFGGLNNNSTGVAFGDGKQLNTVGLQSTGRIIGAGSDQDNNNLLLGYTASGNLDQSFGQGGTFVQTATPGIYTSVIDSSDRLVIAYNVGGNLTLARILSDGSGLDTTFGTDQTGVVATDITTTGNSNLRVAIDNSGNIAAAVVRTDGISFSVARYTSAGVVSGGVATFGGSMGLANFTITKMLVDTNNALVIVGYDNATNNQIVVTRVVYSSGAYELDSTFNAYDAVTNPSGIVGGGYIQYAVHGTANQQTAGAFIHADGRIIITGAQQA